VLLFVITNTAPLVVLVSCAFDRTAAVNERTARSAADLYVKNLDIKVFSLSKVDLSGRSEVASYYVFDEGRQKSRSMQQNSPANVQRSDEQMCLL
jgi:hypothetical protein